MNQMQGHIQSIAAGTKVADVAAVGSISAAATVGLTNLNLYVQIAAGVVAIIAGLSAAIFHAYKTYHLHKHRNDKL